jgi:hypothetical protein
MLVDTIRKDLSGSVTKNQIYMKIAILCALFFGATNFNPVEAQSFRSPVHSDSKTAPVVFSFVRGHKLGKGFNVQWSMGTNVPVERFEVQSTN